MLKVGITLYELMPTDAEPSMASDNQRIEWMAGKTRNEVVHSDEPNATWGQQLRLPLVSMFVEEDLL